MFSVSEFCIWDNVLSIITMWSLLGILCKMHLQLVTVSLMMNIPTWLQLGSVKLEKKRLVAVRAKI